MFSKISLFTASILLCGTGITGASELVTDIETVLKDDCLESFQTTYKKMFKRKAFAAANDADGNHVCAWTGTTLFGANQTFPAKADCEKKRKALGMSSECEIISDDGKIKIKKGVLHEWDASAQPSKLSTPAAAPAGELTNKNIDQFLTLMPGATKAMESLQKKLSKEANQKMMGAMSKGAVFRTVIEVAADTKEISDLEVDAKKSGFESLSDWAYTSDRITSVFMTSELVSAIASIPYAEKGYTEGTNVFDFLADESKSAEVRNKLRTELEKECAKSCIVPADLDMVGARIGEVSAMFKGM